MPKSDTLHLDYYPPGWSEYANDPQYVEWTYDNDPSIVVRVDGTMGKEQYSVTPVTSITEHGEEFVTRPISGLTAEVAFDVAATVLYAMNGILERIENISIDSE